jgi:glycine oxidase
MPRTAPDSAPDARPHDPGSGPRVLVVGAGIIGLACARELARFGARVEVVERRHSGAEASSAAAGMLSPLAEAPGPGPFFDACRAARDAWAFFRVELEEESGLDVDYDDSGALLAAIDAGDEEELWRIQQAARQLGEPAEEADLAEVRERVPALSPKARRVLLLRGEHRVDNVKVCAALARATERAGATLSTGCEVQRVEAGASGVRVEGSGWRREADALVLAAGAWSARLPGLPPLPVRPVRGQMLLLGGVDWAWKGIVRGPHHYTVRRGLTGLLVGSTVEEAGFACHTTVEGLEQLFSFTHSLLPGLAGARVETNWAGLRPGTPDDLPLIGRLGALPVVAATGHYRNGILLAPWTARQVASIVLDGETAPEARPFSPDRFA